MELPSDPNSREELLELYSQLHLSCGRAAAALRLSAYAAEPDAELLQRFRDEDDRAARLWARISELRGV